MKKNEIVAMVLAGGKGTRLKGLTRKNAKPAVYFGGKYRIIDFVLSNLANSNINKIGLLTQYETVELNQYTSSGKHWGFDGNNSSFTLLSPREKEEGSYWYKGTADAIYQNLDFLESLSPEYVLIASSDHIYKMNYSKMLDFLKQRGGDVAIAAIEVEKEEISRFGILTTDENLQITSFVEKPKHSDSNKASMGIYIFRFKTLVEALRYDARQEDSSHDFGKDIIPYLLKKNRKIYAFPFYGYWRDVGTIASLWKANMDLVDDIRTLDLYEMNSTFKVYSEDTRSLPQYIGANAEVKRSLVNQGSSIFGKVEHSVIFTNVVVEEGAEIYDSVLMPNVSVKRGAVIRKAIIANGVTIEEDRKINEACEEIALIER